MIVIMRAAASGKPVGINVSQVRFLRSNADDVTAIVFGKSGEEHMVLVKGALVRVAEDLNMALRRRDIAPAPCDDRRSLQRPA
ncbi:MAG TPA: hypothetical protein VEZ48_14740 [Sphingomonadaceae bacterium]|nr:hypothetical protein [Sphingomonadaceae bacterium]